MRIFYNNQIILSIERDNRLSKYNYGSCKNYSIYNILLELLLLYNNSYFTEDPIVYILTNLMYIIKNNYLK